ncbi:parallel beta-helix repeat (two copies) [Candidatus Electrothrix aarhusensis]|uniref:Parallel beta-helix repeat (Two copies) n=1 Tax=Candidatus Electrothrix aarhusensis TaxID=1859131 RepID=A0A444IZI1_9BACT|nr:parallel beta-helix repeat (two copies) [Candidatus Electrothrix aarhusensis]
MQNNIESKRALTPTQRILYACLIFLSITLGYSSAHKKDAVEVSLSYYEKELLPQRSAQRPEKFGHTIDESKAVNIFYVDCNDPFASDQNAGTTDSPFRTIASAVHFVNEQRIPARIIIRPGTYQENIVLAGDSSGKDPVLIIEAEKKGTVFISGSVAQKGWEKENKEKYYSAGWPYKWGFSRLEYEYKLKYTQLGRRKEIVTLNDTLLTQKLSLSELDAGSFFIDEQLGKIYLNPPERIEINKADVEAGVITKLFEIKQRANFILRGITIQHAMGSMHEVALRLANVSNFLIEDCTVFQNGTIGILLVLAVNGTLRRVSSIQNGGNGMDMYIAQSILVEDSEFSFNCWRSHQAQVWHYFPAGAKLCHTRNIELRRNTFIGNLARGFWVDINGEFNTFKENLVMDNTDFGVFIETSHGPTRIENNRITGNRYGIMIAESWLTELTGNTIFQNRMSQIGVRAIDNRTQQDIKNREFFYAQETRGEHLIFRYLPMKLTMNNNILFSDNKEDALYRHGVAMGTDFGEHIKTYRGNNNILYHTKKEKAFLPEPVYADLTLEQWQKKTGQDKHSQWKNPEIYYVTIQHKGNNILIDSHNSKSAVTTVALYGAKMKNSSRKDPYFVGWNTVQEVATRNSWPYTFALPPETAEGHWMFFAKVYTADNQVLHSRRISVER